MNKGKTNRSFQEVLEIQRREMEDKKRMKSKVQTVRKEMPLSEHLNRWMAMSSMKLIQLSRLKS